jgi:hypothetical protein
MLAGEQQGHSKLRQEARGGMWWRVENLKHMVQEHPLKEEAVVHGREPSDNQLQRDGTKSRSKLELQTRRQCKGAGSGGFKGGHELLLMCNTDRCDLQAAQEPTGLHGKPVLTYSKSDSR